MGIVTSIFDHMNASNWTPEQIAQNNAGLAKVYAQMGEQEARRGAAREARELTLDELAARIEYQQRKQQPTQNAHGVRVGDLYYDTWGYEQTNVDFYQVIALKGSQTAVIRRIASDYGPDGYAMQGNVTPMRGQFIDGKEEIQRRTRTDSNGMPQVSSPRGSGHYLWLTGDDTPRAYTSYA